jgi:hypothetical protein
MTTSIRRNMGAPDCRLQRLPQSHFEARTKRAPDPNVSLIPQHRHVLAVGILPQLLDHVDVDDGGAVNADESIIEGAVE